MSILSETLDLVAEGGEIAIDAALDEGILRDVPILSSAIAVVRLKRTISDSIFFAKVKKMLLQLDTVSPHERAQFEERLKQEPSLAGKVGECLVLACNALDDLAKAEMLGVAFASYIRGTTSFDSFRRVAAAIQSGFIDDLLSFARSGNKPVGLVEPYLFRLFHTGLVVYSPKIREGSWEEVAILDDDCDVTDAGRDFLKAVGPFYEKHQSS